MQGLQLWEPRCKYHWRLQLPGPAAAEPGRFDGLVELFPAAEGLVREAPPETGGYTMLFEEYAKHQRASPTRVGERPIVDSLDAFVARFEEQCPDVLPRLQQVRCPRNCGWFVAGGAVLRAAERAARRGRRRRSTPSRCTVHRRR